MFIQQMMKKTQKSKIIYRTCKQRRYKDSILTDKNVAVVLYARFKFDTDVCYRPILRTLLYLSRTFIRVTRFISMHSNKHLRQLIIKIVCDTAMSYTSG